MSERFAGNGPEQNQEMQQYFSQLPIYVQETITQSGVCPGTLEELRQCAQHLMQGDR